MKPSEHTLEAARGLVSTCRSDGRRVVFTNGVFDLLHLGHVTYLEAAKSLGDVLIVGMNNDGSVRRLGKGDDRPINPEHARAGVLAALRCVDAVVIFGDDTPYTLIEALQPDVLAKGGDYDPEVTDPADKRYMVGSDVVRARGGRVVSIPLVSGYSTTALLSRSKQA